MKHGAMGRAITEPDLMDRVGVAVREARERKQLSQMKLGNRVGVDHSMINRIESGQRMPSTTLLIRLARELDLSIDRVLGIAA